MSEITAARLTNLHERIKLILGNGAGENGYGQTVSSYQVNSLNNLIDAQDINSIYADMIRARIHQVGPGDIGIAQVIENLNVVAEDTSFFVDDQGVSSIDPEGNIKGISDFENLMSDIEVDKFLIHPSQGSLELGIQDRRTNDWNGLIFQEVTVTFNDADHRRHFFNTGGELRFSASNTNATGVKGLDWAELCSEIGTVSFNHSSTTSTGDGSGTSIGNYQLTTAYQTVYQKVGAGTYSGIYAGNLYTIKARYDALNPNVLLFRIEFNDVAIDNNVDNNVDGRLDSIIQQFRADSESVTVDPPSYFAQTSLGSFSTPVVVTPPTGGDALVVSVIDECSVSESTIRSSWLEFRTAWPNREFFILQPDSGPYGSYTAANLKIPAEYTSDSLANSPIPVIEDNGNTNQRLDWFELLNLGTRPSGTIISLSPDTSGSMTIAKVQASYDLFLEKCANAGFVVVQTSMDGENWITGHNVDLP